MAGHSFVSSLPHLKRFNLTNTLQYLIFQFMSSLLGTEEKASRMSQRCGHCSRLPQGPGQGALLRLRVPRVRAGQQVVRPRSGLGGSAVSAGTARMSHFLRRRCPSSWRLPDRKVPDSPPKWDTEHELTLADTVQPPFLTPPGASSAFFLWPVPVALALGTSRPVAAGGPPHKCPYRQMWRKTVDDSFVGGTSGSVSCRVLPTARSGEEPKARREGGEAGGAASGRGGSEIPFALGYSRGPVGRSASVPARPPTPAGYGSSAPARCLSPAARARLARQV